MVQKAHGVKEHAGICHSSSPQFSAVREVINSNCLLTCRSLHTLDSWRMVTTNPEVWTSREVREAPKILARLIEKAEF